MANSLSVRLGIIYKNDTGDVRFSVPSRSATQTVASNIYASGVQNIGTSHEAIDLATVASDGGAAYFFNRDDTNFVEIGREISTVFEKFTTIGPGEFAYLPGVSDKDIFAKADTAAIDLEYFILEP